MQFVLAGKWRDDAIDYLRSIATPNVVFTGQVENPTLIDLYTRSSVYVQLSRHEGFGLSVAEAMLAGCIPGVTRVGSLPEVVGDAGIYVDTKEPAEIARAIHEFWMSISRSAMLHATVSFGIFLLKTDRRGSTN